MSEWDNFSYFKYGIIQDIKYVNKEGHTIDPEVSNQPVGFNVRPTNTVVLYCIKYR